MPNRTSVLALSLAISGIVLLGLARPAGATLWQPLQTTARSQTELDVDSIVKKDGVVTAWIQQVNAEPVASKSGAYYVYRTMKMQVRYQCAQRAMTVLSRNYYNDGGVEVGSERSAEEARTAAPETAEDRALSVACAADPKKAAVALRRADAAPVQARYMDGPAPIERRAGLIRTSADAHGADAHGADAHGAPAKAPAAKPADAHAPAAAAAKPADAHAPAAPAAAAPTAAAAAAPSVPNHGVPAPIVMPGSAPTAAHGAPVAHGAPAAAHGAQAPVARKAPAGSRDSESRERVVARVMKDRGLGTPAALKPIEVVGHEEAHWDYEGENAPYRWGDMKTEFAACKSGQRQSPIDIRNPVMAQLDPIVFHYEESPLKVLNNGHTIQVEFAPGSFIIYGGARYELIQMHFHTPSEERINGRPFDMVAHLVHKNAQGKLAVIAVLLGEGKSHPAIETIWNTMPGTAGRTRERADIAFNPMAILPADRGFYSFQGSLTTPPCSEGVQWLVLKTPVELGREQIVHFGALYPMNARPIQPTNDRVIKVGG